MTAQRWFPGSLIATALAACTGANTPASPELLKLRVDVEQLAKPYLVAKDDVAIHIAPSLFVALSTSLANLPAESRRIAFDGVSRSGYVWSSGSGVLGCGGYAEINDGGRNFHFILDIKSLGATWQPDGTLLTQLNVGFFGSGNVHGHAHGPPGPCSLWKLAPTCECPIGGGIGSNAGFTTRKDITFEGIIKFAEMGGQLGYALSLTKPREISTTLEVGLEKIGTVGIPIKLAVPTSPVLSGKAAATLANKGVLKLPSKDLPYTFDVGDIAVTSDATGISLRGRAVLKSDSRTPAR